MTCTVSVDALLAGFCNAAVQLAERCTEAIAHDPSYCDSCRGCAISPPPLPTPTQPPSIAPISSMSSPAPTGGPTAAFTPTPSEPPTVTPPEVAPPGKCAASSVIAAAAAGICGVLRDGNGPLAACIGAVDPAPYYNACVASACSQGDADAGCSFVMLYADGCAESGVVELGPVVDACGGCRAKTLSDGSTTVAYAAPGRGGIGI